MYRRNTRENVIPAIITINSDNYGNDDKDESNNNNNNNKQH